VRVIVAYMRKERVLLNTAQIKLIRPKRKTNFCVVELLDGREAKIRLSLTEIVKRLMGGDALAEVFVPNRTQ